MKTSTISSIRLIKTMMISLLEKLNILQRRLHEVGVLWEMQAMESNSIHYCKELKRRYSHAKIANDNVQSKLIMPEHFERVVDQSFRKAGREETFLGRSNSNPWEGSLFKNHLLSSLYNKLSKKVVFQAILCYMKVHQSSRQIIKSLSRNRLRRIMQLCFSSLLLDVLASKYIAFASEKIAQRMIMSKYARPVYSTWKKLIYDKHNRTLLFCRSRLHMRNRALRKGINLLFWYSKYHHILRIKKLWAILRYKPQQQLAKGFVAWVAAFLKKNRLRLRIVNLYKVVNPGKNFNQISSKYYRKSIASTDDNSFYAASQVNDCYVALNRCRLRLFDELRNTLLIVTGKISKNRNVEKSYLSTMQYLKETTTTFQSIACATTTFLPTIYRSRSQRDNYNNKSK